jgi:uncharacterized membrane protein
MLALLSLIFECVSTQESLGTTSISGWINYLGKYLKIKNGKGTQMTKLESAMKIETMKAIQNLMPLKILNFWEDLSA